MSDLQLFDALPPHIEAALRDSIEEFGVLVPVFVTQDGEVLDGHHRSRIARDLGVQFETTVVEVEDEEHALRIAHTLNSDRRQLSTGDRLAAAARLRERGHSYRAIGEALGASEATVRRDVERAGASGDAPEQPAEVRGIDGKTYPATKPPTVKTTERRSESTTVERTPAPVRAPSPRCPVEGHGHHGPNGCPQAVEEWVEGDESLKDKQYLHAFYTALSRNDWLRFDAGRVGLIGTDDDVRTVELHLANTKKFLDDMKRARSGLRVMNGGKA